MMRPLHVIAMDQWITVKNIDADGGAFTTKSPVDRRLLRIIASNGMGWDHVSVSRSDRTPTWSELEFVKRLFFTEDEVAMQLHVPPANHINVHPHCLHLWRPQAEPIPMPPEYMV